MHVVQGDPGGPYEVHTSYMYVGFSSVGGTYIYVYIYL